MLIYTFITRYRLNLRTNVSEAFGERYALDKAKGCEDIGNVVQPSASGSEAISVLTHVPHQHFECIIKGE